QDEERAVHREGLVHERQQRDGRGDRQEQERRTIVERAGVRRRRGGRARAGPCPFRHGADYPSFRMSYSIPMVECSVTVALLGTEPEEHSVYLHQSCPPPRWP